MQAARLAALRTKLALIEAARDAGVLPFGDRRIDAALPGGGLPLGRWHEVHGEGVEVEFAAASGAFLASLIAPLADRGALVWVLLGDDLFAPGLAGLGLPAERLIQVRAANPAQALAALEDALATRGVAAAVAEADTADLTAGRRLQLACETHGATGFLLRRRRFAARRPEPPGSASATRWKVAPAPSQPAAGEPGLGAPRWRVELERARGGRTGAWLLERSDGAFPLRVVADLGDRRLATAEPLSLAG